MRYDLTVDTTPQALIIVVVDPSPLARDKVVSEIEERYGSETDPAMLGARVSLVESAGGMLVLDHTVAQVLRM